MVFYVDHWIDFVTVMTHSLWSSTVLGEDGMKNKWGQKKGVNDVLAHVLWREVVNAWLYNKRWDRRKLFQYSCSGPVICVYTIREAMSAASQADVIAVDNGHFVSLFFFVSAEWLCITAKKTQTITFEVNWELRISVIVRHDGSVLELILTFYSGKQMQRDGQFIWTFTM